MPHFSWNKRLIILLTSIILLVAMIGFSLNDRDHLTWPERFIKDSVGLIQSGFHQPANYIAGFFENISEISHTYEENKVLKARLDEYVSLLQRNKELQEENEELRALLDKKESLRHFVSIQATVIARNPEQWHDLIIINKGDQHGIEKNMAVITAKGLIGKVKSVAEFYSTVQLLSDMDRTNRISAIVKGNENIFGLIEGYHSEKEALLFRRIPFDVDVEVGQVVISSGLGGVFPRGLVIGKIEEIIPDDYGLTQTAYVEPAADFYDIDHVMIVDREMITPKEQPLEKEEEAK